MFVFSLLGTGIKLWRRTLSSTLYGKVMMIYSQSGNSSNAKGKKSIDRDSNSLSMKKMFIATAFLASSGMFFIISSSDLPSNI